MGSTVRECLIPEVSNRLPTDNAYTTGSRAGSTRLHANEYQWSFERPRKETIVETDADFSPITDCLSNLGSC